MPEKLSSTHNKLKQNTRNQKNYSSEIRTGSVHIILIKNYFYSIVFQGINNSPDLGAVLETFFLNLLLHIDMNPSSLSLFYALHLEPHSQHLSDNCSCFRVARSTTLKGVLDGMFNR
ncbi:hypothetical protein OIU79_021659 [Salix purpurea]|uniref:Uncharacterized protein n=1 Tax=Salix purpurea TaxID=77065 RepID=A0A9Q1ABV7_SALPP|nr:hypothetical protein OIU79_021659 [Salix purpurea]